MQRLKLCRYVSLKTAITITAKTAAYTALVTDFTIVFNTNAGGFEVTSTAAADNTGKVYVISKRDGTVIIFFRKPAWLSKW
jgi:hypothetical protein